MLDKINVGEITLIVLYGLHENHFSTDNFLVVGSSPIPAKAD